MIEEYRRLAIFVAVVDAGSFSEAGRRLKLSTASVSHHISKLESKLGVALFFRSTRSLSLSQEGQAMLGAARRMIAAGDEALDAHADNSEQPVGALRVAIPAFGQSTPIYQQLWSFALQHPMVSISLRSSDTPVDLIKDGVDVAIRLGVLADSSLKSRRISDFNRLLVAAPEYLAKQKPIKTLKDLSLCDFIAVAALPDAVQLISGKEHAAVEFDNVRLEVDTIAAAISAVKAGLGLRGLPEMEIRSDLDAGTLVQVLPEWQLPLLNIYAVWLENGPQKKLTRRLIDHLVSGST